MVVEVILPIVLVATLTKTVLVVDVVGFSGRGSGVVARTAQAIRSQQTSRAHTTCHVASPRNQLKGTASTGASNAKSVHRRLLSMHATSAINHSAAVAKYLLPVSDTSCVVTHRIMMAFLLLYDASLVMFLLAKTHVVNGNRTLACWENGVIWWSRIYACVYLPITALYLGLDFPGSANTEGTFCYNGFTKDDTSKVKREANLKGFALNNALLIIQFVLLLGMFIKPMLVRVEGAQSGGSLYRTVVLKNAICTAGIVVSYAITTVVVVLALLRESPVSNQSARIKDVTLGTNLLVTLCLTEISLPIGFTTLVKACMAENSQRGSTTTLAMGKTTKKGTTGARTLTNSTNAKAIVPLEESPPQMP